MNMQNKVKQWGKQNAKKNPFMSAVAAAKKGYLVAKKLLAARSGGKGARQAKKKVAQAKKLLSAAVKKRDPCTQGTRLSVSDRKSVV